MRARAPCGMMLGNTRAEARRYALHREFTLFTAAMSQRAARYDPIRAMRKRYVMLYREARWRDDMSAPRSVDVADSRPMRMSTRVPRVYARAPS